MTHEKQNQILNYWFGDDPLKMLARRSIWFARNAQIDQEIKTLFEPLLEEAAHGGFDDWAKTPRGALALVILLDQFPRNMYRGDDQSFSYGAHAFKIAQIAIAHSLDQKLGVCERCFLYLPFEHEESLDAQTRSVELFSAAMKDAETTEEKRFVSETMDFAQRHYDVISKFGRFPHRNQIFGRESTPTEREFLKQPGSYF